MQAWPCLVEVRNSAIFIQGKINRWTANIFPSPSCQRQMVGVIGIFMTRFIRTYLFILIAIVMGSCGNMIEENQGEEKTVPQVFNCLLDSIGKNDTLQVNYITKGCFHSYMEKLSIYRKADSLFAELTVSVPDVQMVLPPLSQCLTDSAALAFVEFEKEGRALNNENTCTTNDEYIVIVRADSLKFEDLGCEFRRYDILKNRIFGREQINSYYNKLYQ